MAIWVGVNMMQFCSVSNSLSQLNLSNKVRGIFFLKEVFARLYCVNMYYCVNMCMYMCIYAYLLCGCTTPSCLRVFEFCTLLSVALSESRCLFTWETPSNPFNSFRHCLSIRLFFYILSIFSSKIVCLLCFLLLVCLRAFSINWLVEFCLSFRICWFICWLSLDIFLKFLLSPVLCD